MIARVRSSRWAMAAAISLVAVGLVAAAAFAAMNNKVDTKSEHWGVIERNTIGSPVAQLRDGPYLAIPGDAGQPPFGKGSLGIEVADRATSQTPPAEKVAFGDETDFLGQPVLGITAVGYQVYNPSENVGYGGGGATGQNNLPNITIEIDPNLSSIPNNFASMVWNPDGSAVPDDQWSPYIDATTNGYWYFTGATGTATNCTQATQCSFAQALAALNDGGDAPVVLSVAISKGRDYMWSGAVDGFRYNDRVYDFESDGVHQKDVK